MVILFHPGAEENQDERGFHWLSLFPASFYYILIGFPLFFHLGDPANTDQHNLPGGEPDTVFFYGGSVFTYEQLLHSEQFGKANMKTIKEKIGI